MKINSISTTKSRANMRGLIEKVRQTNEVFVIGSHKNSEVIIMKFPGAYNPNLSLLSNINTYSQSFHFLKLEPDLYSVSDIIKKTCTIKVVLSSYLFRLLTCRARR